jgi:hypothetical protein
MQDISILSVWLPLIALAIVASHFRLRGRTSLFWTLVSLGFGYRLAASLWLERAALDIAMDIVSFAVVAFLIDLFVEYRFKKRAKLHK